jgi:hypothetical protein
MNIALRWTKRAFSRIYVGTAVAALYLNIFVAPAQSFQKLPFLHELAPTQSAPPFLVSQLPVPAVFVALGALAARRFHPGIAATALAR